MSAGEYVSICVLIVISFFFTTALVRFGFERLEAKLDELNKNREGEGK
jgi:hypothetical protein